MRDTVAFGDSGSDVPLFRELTHTVSVSGTPSIAGLSAVEHRGNSLLGKRPTCAGGAPRWSGRT